MRKRITILLFLFCFCTSALFAEYRAYQFEIYNHLEKKSREVISGFAPDQFIQLQGYSNHFGVLLKATWMCYGIISQDKKTCEKPPPISPKFNLNDIVQVTLDKHITAEWSGKIELLFYREDLRTNVYGVRFINHRNLYNRYFERDLKLIKKQAQAKKGTIKKK